MKEEINVYALFVKMRKVKHLYGSRWSLEVLALSSREIGRA